jgi:hypothetical protein
MIAALKHNFVERDPTLTQLLPYQIKTQTAGAAFINMTRHFLIALCLIAGLALSAPAQAADHLIDSTKAHAAVNFSIKHLGFSWQIERFDNFSGTFSFDEANPRAS